MFSVVLTFRIGSKSGKLLLFGKVRKMKLEDSKTLLKQMEAALSEQRFRLVAAASEPGRLVNSPAPIQGHFIRLTKSRVI